jgi:hypothetical protein
VTQPLRTVLDLADRPIGDELYRGFVNHCIATRLLTLRGLERHASEHGRYVSGIHKLQALLAELGPVDSLAEAELVDLLASAGIPRPIRQFEVRDGARFVGRVDVAWPGERVALELDGFRYHADARTFVHDRERGNRIVALGWALLRTTPTAVRERPHAVVADVRQALNRASALLVSQP